MWGKILLHVRFNFKTDKISDTKILMSASTTSNVLTHGCKMEKGQEWEGQI